jgi:exonuclease SbcC
MNPKRLLLKGFRGIKDGMGLDTYELDLETLGEARLVAIAGPNGKGKSTVLDNLHPYPLLPSRAASYTVAGFSMYDHVIPPEALKELDWTHEDKTYRSSMLWRNSGKRRSCEAYLLQRQADATWAPMRLADGAVSDGKVETYNRLLVAILGSPEMFFSSQFSAQGRRKLFEYKEGELKHLLVELLGLGSIAELGASAQHVLKAVAIAAEALRVAAAPSKDAAEPETFERLVAEASVAKQRLTDVKALEDSALSEAGNALAIAKARAEQDGSLQRRGQLERELTALSTQEERENTERCERRNRAVAEMASIDKAACDAASAFNAQRKLRHASIQSREQLVAQREVIKAAPERVRSLAAEIATLEARLKAARERHEAQLKARAELAVVDGDLRGMRDAYTWAKQALAEIHARSKLAAEVPCAGSDLQPRCKLLRDALEAAAKTAPAEAHLVKLCDDGKVICARRTEIERSVGTEGGPTRECAEAEESLRSARKAKEDAERLASLAPALETVEGELAAIRAELAAIEVEYEMASAKGESRKADLATALLALEDEGKTRAALREAERQRLQSELSKLADPALDAVSAAQAARDSQAAKVQALERELVAATAELSALQTRLAETREATRQRAALYQRHEVLRAEQSYWQLLAKALGKDGLIAMLIDEAGPTLATIANDILLACYGRRFTMSIVTQRKNAAGEPVETFDILVHDADTNEAKSLAVMSGGQKVWINEALTRAIALYMARGNERRYQALFCDESDGPLDAERKRMFVQMQRKVLELGGYERAFFITQTPELLGYADAVIDLS